MISRRMMTILAVLCLLVATVACGPKVHAPQSQLDTPEHHVLMGNKLLKAGKLDAAMREFMRAKQLDPKFSPAYLGLGLVLSEKGEYKAAWKNLKAAYKYAKTKDQKYDAVIGKMRFYLAGKEKIDKTWYDENYTLSEQAKVMNRERPEAYYYQGLTYKYTYKFNKAGREFTKVLDLDKGLVAEADAEYALVQKIQRAMPGTSIGKKIALLDTLSRADLAALLIQELNLDRIYARATKKKFDTSFKTPDRKFPTGKYVKAPKATDIDTHVLKADIEAVMAMGIKGLQPYPDHTYQPDKTVNRAEFAMIVEDALFKITRDEKLATAYIGNASPFPDLRSDLPFFNAVMVCTTRGIMSAKDVGTGEFAPMEEISGADSLLSIRTLKTQLSKY